MKNSDNIEKLFKETFDRFEADVNPGVWTNVHNTLSSTSGSATSGAAKFTLGKIIAGVVSLAVISGSVWYLSTSGDQKISPTEKQLEVVENSSKDAIQNSKSEQQPNKINSNTNTSAKWQTPPAVRTLNQNITDNTSPEQITSSKSTGHTISSETSTSENNTTAASPPSGKYGNATQGDGGMIRGNPVTNTSSSNVTSPGTSADTQIEDLDSPAATIFVNTSSGDAPLTVDFINQGTASSLSWDFGDGTFSKESAPTHTFEKPGNYVVKLTAKNSSGTSADKVNIEVRAISSITNIPNIFTPNGDGENDYFFFEMKNIASVGVAIYSQGEGKQIYTWNSVDGKWNGKLMNGENAPEGVYLYSIQANGTDGVVHSKRGVITLSIKR